MTFGQSSILIDHDGRARLTDFEFASIVRETNSTMQANKYTVAWSAPEILEGTGTVAWETDVFAFGMVVIEVGPLALPPLVLEAEGWMVSLMPEFCTRFLQEGLRSVISQPRSLLQGLGVANARIVRRRRKNED